MYVCERDGAAGEAAGHHQLRQDQGGQPLHPEACQELQKGVSGRRLNSNASAVDGATAHEGPARPRPTAGQTAPSGRARRIKSPGTTARKWHDRPMAGCQNQGSLAARRAPVRTRRARPGGGAVWPRSPHAELRRRVRRERRTWSREAWKGGGASGGQACPFFSPGSSPLYRQGAHLSKTKRYPRDPELPK